MSRILVLEDQEHLARLLQADLESMRHRVRVFSDATAVALEVEYWRPELVVLDLDATAFDALDVLALLKSDRATAELPVLVLTVDETSDAAAQAWELGVSFALAKPINAGDLESAVQRLLALESGAA